MIIHRSFTPQASIASPPISFLRCAKSAAAPDDVTGRDEAISRYCSRGEIPHLCLRSADYAIYKSFFAFSIGFASGLIRVMPTIIAREAAPKIRIARYEPGRFAMRECYFHASLSLTDAAVITV